MIDEERMSEAGKIIEWMFERVPNEEKIPSSIKPFINMLWTIFYRFLKEVDSRVLMLIFLGKYYAYPSKGFRYKEIQKGKFDRTKIEVIGLPWEKRKMVFPWGKNIRREEAYFKRVERLMKTPYSKRVLAELTESKPTSVDKSVRRLEKMGLLKTIRDGREIRVDLSDELLVFFEKINKVGDLREFVLSHSVVKRDEKGNVYRRFGSEIQPRKK